MSEEYKIYLDSFNTNEKIDITRILEVEKELKVKFPADYVDFMEKFNGGEGSVGKEYLIMYKINEIIEVNDDCEVSEYVPGIILFGSNGGGEYFAFDYRESEIKYIIIPSMLDYDDIIIQSVTLKGLFKRLYNGMIFENCFVDEGDK
ncbi:hypothetical protein B0P06_005804 [Clostridium saccharoperbutylacetonicum]|uniref:SMI1 / KNR4 family n=1 Tax=Clostridium saccharoperbutylacetonicum N1-4(HMT) TaxID=931276 RepID=M1LSI1_9CLOT|nr:SMI1/KNR4 family protein [Clostridium saccharoperbutylacetonicum]AGF55940.1 SMI1 / KNR4 family [Clostridium saccharoperbutylacetonicum N1-4(HMT)]NRT63321.1 hypothetical protein [Clostridium saccharoperbutylacetonicum]NSB26683.1 hypothetical protein [Clostridium saccharoperbutylacetonicum]NSB46033.1 hypothetical protein [Clostridium saccharoperbutylacetonicum]